MSNYLTMFLKIKKNYNIIIFAFVRYEYCKNKV